MRVSRSTETAVERDFWLAANRERSRVHSDVIVELIMARIKVALTIMYKLSTQY